MLVQKSESQKLRKICETTCGYHVHAIEVLGGELYSVEVSWRGDDPEIFHATELHNGSILIEKTGCYAEYLYGEWCGDVSRYSVDSKHSSNAQEMSATVAKGWIEKLSQSGYVGEYDSVWDDITQGYFEDGGGVWVSQYLFWSDSIGCIAGPGSESPDISHAISDIKDVLWPVLSATGRPSAEALRDCLLSGVPRKIDPEYALIGRCHLYNREEIYGGIWAPLWSDCDEDLLDCDEDLKRWLCSISAYHESPVFKQAIASTVHEINVWLKTHEALQLTN